MAGFVIRNWAAGLNHPADTLKLVDIGDCDSIRGVRFRHGHVAWARWQDSRQLQIIEGNGRLLWIEGQPDRAIGPKEPLEEWLQGRGGSFRGFHVQQDASGQELLTVFVDQMGTRPMFLLRTADQIWISDKLATIAVNSQGLESDWGALLECAVLRTTYSKTTTLRGVEMLAPGEVIDIRGATVLLRHASPVVLESRVEAGPGAAKRLEDALRTAIRETWTDSDSCLLLSGGLDSRLILGLAEGRRKTLTVNRKSHETAIARQVAAACSAELQVDPFPHEHYCGVMRHAYLVTGAMHESKLTNHLGMTKAWRKAGIRAIVHGYLHNTVFRGWASERQFRFEKINSPVGKLMGPKAYYFDNLGVTSRTNEAAVIGLLSEDGRQVLKKQLSDLGAALDPVIIDGFDLTFERLLLRDVARQVYYGGFKGWLEEIDVESPVFHPAIWRWYATTHPKDRHRDTAVRQIYARIGRGLADIPDSNTMRKVNIGGADPREAWGNQIWYPAARRVWRFVTRYVKKPPKPATDWALIFRQPAIVESMRNALEAAKRNPLINKAALETAETDYLNGNDAWHDPLWSIATMGQWDGFVRTGGTGNAAVRPVQSQS